MGLFASFGAPRFLSWQLHKPRRCTWRALQVNGDVFAFDREANSSGLHCVEPVDDAQLGDRISISLWGQGCDSEMLPSAADVRPMNLAGANDSVALGDSGTSMAGAET